MERSALEKSPVVIGSFDEDSFQLNLKDGGQLKVNLFDVFGFPCVPLIGCYGEDFNPVVPFVLLQTDTLKCVPENIPLQRENITDAFFMIHGNVAMQPCMHFTCEKYSEFNIIPHTYVYDNYEFSKGRNISSFFLLFFEASCFKGDQNRVIDIGLFDGENVSECHMNGKDPKGSGIPFGKMEERECCIHGYAFSPHNNNLDRTLEKDLSFWTVIKCGEKKVCVTYHHVCQENEDQMRKDVKQSNNLEQLIGNIKNKKVVNVLKDYFF